MSKWNFKESEVVNYSNSHITDCFPKIKFKIIFTAVPCSYKELF
jgi:hypothetical protein